MRRTTCPHVTALKSPRDRRGSASAAKSAASSSACSRCSPPRAERPRPHEVRRGEGDVPVGKLIIDRGQQSARLCTAHDRERIFRPLSASSGTASTIRVAAGKDGRQARKRLADLGEQDDIGARRDEAPNRPLRRARDAPEVLKDGAVHDVAGAAGAQDGAWPGDEERRGDDDDPGCRRDRTPRDQQENDPACAEERSGEQELRREIERRAEVAEKAAGEGEQVSAEREAPNPVNAAPIRPRSGAARSQAANFMTKPLDAFAYDATSLRGTSLQAALQPA